MLDDEIIGMYNSRDEQALNETKIRYGKLIFTIAFNVLKNFLDSEECENDTYLSLWNNIPPEKPVNFKDYFLSITRKLALKKYEYNHAKKRNMFDCVPYDELCSVTGNDCMDMVEQRELVEILNAFLGRISKEEQRIFILRYWYFLSIKEIGKECRITDSKVKVKLFRIRSKLHDYLVEEGVLNDESNSISFK